MSFETAIVILNVVVVAAIGGFIIWRVVSLRRNPEPRAPLNLAPGLPDEDLEGRKLERVLGWALLFTLVLAVALPVYFIFEPSRQVSASDTFLKQSVARGATIFANQQSKAYNATTSLLCANCHGVHGEAARPRSRCSLRPTSASSSRTRATPACLSAYPSRCRGRRRR